MVTRCRSFALLLACAALAGEARAGGGWVPAQLEGTVALHVSRKTASHSWDAYGNTLPHVRADGFFTIHDFRYYILAAELGIADDVGPIKHVSAFLVLPFLYAFEGAYGSLEKGVGFSDLWFGAKAQLLDGDWPLALSANVRVPWLYDASGPYRRFDSADDELQRRLSSEWRGLGKYDVGATAHLSHALLGGRGWSTLEAGYIVRTGAPSDQVMASADVGLRILAKEEVFVDVALKVFSAAFVSVGNDSAPDANDRFDHAPGLAYTMNDASMWKLGGSALIWLTDHLILDVGYAQWIWGRSARQYREPFASLAYTF